MKMPFGKHKGKELHEVPDDYLLWVLDNCERISPTLRRLIEVRLGVGDPPPSSPIPPPPEPPPGSLDVRNVVRAWHRMMAKKYHPDVGGTHEQMLVVNDGAELLRQLAGLA